MSGLETGASLLCPGPMTLVGYWGDCRLLTKSRSAVLCSHRARIPPRSLIFGRCSRCRQSSLLDACLAWRGSLLLVCTLWQQVLQGSGGHLNGTLLSILRAAVSASQALILLLWKGARPEDGQVSPCLGLLLALLCACAQLLCLPVVEREEGRDDGGARTRPPGVLRALDARPCPAGVRSQWVLRTAGRQPSRVLLSS